MDKFPREKFNKLDPDTKWKLVTPHLNDLKSSAISRLGVLPQTATLAATLIVVASLNQELVPVSTFELKSILTVLLLLIPTTLGLFIYDTEQAENRSFKRIGDMLGKENLRAEIMAKQKPISKITSFFPRIAVAIFALLILFLIFRIWCS